MTAIAACVEASSESAAGAHPQRPPTTGSTPHAEPPSGRGRARGISVSCRRRAPVASRTSGLWSARSAAALPAPGQQPGRLAMPRRPRRQRRPAQLSDGRSVQATSSRHMSTVAPTASSGPASAAAPETRGYDTSIDIGALRKERKVAVRGAPRVRQFALEHEDVLTQRSAALSGLVRSASDVPRGIHATSTDGKPSSSRDRTLTRPRRPREVLPIHRARITDFARRAGVHDP